MNLLDRRSSIPLYYQLKQRLLERLENGDLAPGEPLPTEMELVAAYAVSRATVRQAMKEIENEGYITRTPGRGTVVLRNKIHRGLTRLSSFSEDMQRQGQPVTSQLVKFEWVTAEAHLSEKLSVEADTQLLYIYRLRLIEEHPIAINISYLNFPQGITITRSELEQIGSIFALLERKGYPPLSTDRTIDAVGASAEYASLLHVPNGAPLLQVDGVVYSLGHWPIEYHQVISIGGIYKYNLHLER